jgi:hypothetical protein
VASWADLAVNVRAVTALLACHAVAPTAADWASCASWHEMTGGESRTLLRFRTFCATLGHSLFSEGKFAMKLMHPAVLICAATLGLAACSQEPDEQETVAFPGSAEQIGKQIDQAVGELQQRANEAGAKLGDRLIETGQSLREGGGSGEPLNE